jgi:soluble lytic murein transglycosylase-like protein
MRTGRAIATIGAILTWLIAETAQAGPIGQPEPELREALREAIVEPQQVDDRERTDAWLQSMSVRLARFMPDADERMELLRLVHGEAARAQIPPELALAVIEVESRFDRYAVSVAGAQGYMQIMPFWLAEIAGPGENLFLDRTNVRMGCTILRYYLDRSQGDLVSALARYNGSYGRPQYPGKVLEALSRRWFRG